MARKLLCSDCGQRYPEVGTKILYQGRPIEYGRILKGKAKFPQDDQRIMYINGEPLPLQLGHFDCDLCGNPINPNDDATCLSIWTEHQKEVPSWEKEFIEINKKEE